MSAIAGLPSLTDLVLEMVFTVEHAADSWPGKQPDIP